MKLLLAAATEAEIAPTIAVLHRQDTLSDGVVFKAGSREITICITGVGLTAATFSLTRALLTGTYDFVLQAGIGGAFDRHIPLGSVVAVSGEQLGDLGAEDRGAFIPIFDLGF